MSSACVRDARRIHLIGIAGVGMTALAQLLQYDGKIISGSDTDEIFFTNAVLHRLKIRYRKKFSGKNIHANQDLFISSGAYAERIGGRIEGRGAALDEVCTARATKKPFLLYSEAIAELFNEKFGIAVSGSHGKSTTTALAAVMLGYARRDLVAVVGTMSRNWNSNAYVNGTVTAQTPFVLEADEYRDAFLRYRPKAAIITNIDWDHPDYFKTPSSYKASFEKFIQRIHRDGSLIYCGDDRLLARLARNARIKVRLSYGFKPSNSLIIRAWTTGKRGTDFTLSYKQKSLGTFFIPLFGQHNVLNATAVAGLGLAVGISPNKIRKGLHMFRGTARRFEIVRKISPIIIDDYAHHPTEIISTIQATRRTFPGKRIVVIFQPHTFSRTKVLFKDFISALKPADRIIILETYSSAREKSRAAGQTRTLADRLGALYAPTHDKAIYFLGKVVKKEDIILTLGAGNIWRIAQRAAKMKYFS